MIACVLACVACRHVVAQDRATGPDGWIDGARSLRYVNGKWVGTGIVTYPGGDRVDWRVVKLPPTVGALTIELQWISPRPGLQLAFDVFDAEHSALGYRSFRREARIDNVKGEVFIRVFARRRGDAGAYRLSVRHERSALRAIDWLAEEIAMPPSLPEVPPPPCTDETFDRRDPACRDLCPLDAPVNWPACHGPVVCAVNSACWKAMPCPEPPDWRVTACRLPPPPCGDLGDPTGYPCPAQEVIAAVLKLDVRDNEVIVTLGAGSSNGVTKNWRGVMLRDRTSKTPYPGGDVVIVRVDKLTTVGKVKLTADQVRATGWVRLRSP